MKRSIRRTLVLLLALLIALPGFAARSPESSPYTSMRVLTSSVSGAM